MDILYYVLALFATPFPTIGPSGPLSSFVGAYQYISQARRMVSEGYTTHSGQIFRIPLFVHWTHVVTGQDRTRELSIEAAITETLQTDYTMGVDLRIHPTHVGVIRSAMTRNLGRRFADVRDEIISAFEDALSLKGTNWKSIVAYPSMMEVVCRTSNRLFVGLPFCRSPEWLELNIRYTIDVAIRGQLIRMFPPILRPIIGPLLSARKKNLRQAIKIIGPLVKQRLLENESSSEQPHNDLISWLLAAAPADRRTVPAIVERILMVNFAAIHTSSMSFTHALFDLAAHPQYAAPLRQEVERVIAEEGWTKTALGKMHQIDSFLRESQRMNGLGIRAHTVVMPRKVVSSRGFRFSDGTVVPHGAFLEVAAMDAHHDPALYDAPDMFDGFRFSRLRDESQDQHRLFRHHMVTTGTDYLPFGHGKHACPGRFFAATELKAMLAHLILQYDVMLDSADGKRPPDQSIASAWIPNRTASVWFRRRSQ
ncbi:cytochrome P450 [Mycena epipterygia]|nr:cytochrome P450 [Mycena epipterygia]